VLYECLTGVPPILGENDKETLKLVTTVQPEPPSAIRTELSRELDHHLLRLLKKDPRERPSSASELEAELTTLLGNASPSYTETDLAKTVQRYFSAEDFSVQTPKENLRSSILQAGMPLRGDETTTDLLATKTVPLNSAAKTAQKKRIDLTVETARKKGRSRSGLRVALLLILLIVSAIFALNEIEQTEKQQALANSKITAHSSLSSTAPRQTSKKESTQRKVRPTKAKIIRTSSQAVGSEDPQRIDGGIDPQETDQVPGSAEWGWVNINSHPWSYVSVDGKRLNGHTPFSRIKLPTGAHVLVFENPELGLKTTKKVTIKAWEESNIGVRLE
jgi:serine/threonine protein kinase